MDYLVNNSNLFKFPSKLWGIHVDPDLKYMGILHMILVDKKIHIDKSILFSDDIGKGIIKASTFLDNKEIFLCENNCSIDQFSEINELLLRLENIGKCINFDRNVDGCLYFSNKGNDFCEHCNDSIFEETKTEEIKLLIEYSCFECHACFKSNELLTKHCKYQHKSNKTCEICNVTVKSNNLTDHMRTHNPEKQFKCSVCLKTFAKRYNLKMHMNIHVGSKPYMCNHCGKSFTAQANLKSHIMHVHEDDKKHACDICQKTFVHPRILRLHMRKHTGEKPYVCEICNRAFSQSIHKKVHMRTHTGEKPYKCDICSKGFITSGNLDWHKKCNHK